jgi:RNA polymerase sigma-70 factor (ECF subfamily)
LQPLPQLASGLQERIAQGRAAWPEIDLGEGVFLRYLSDRAEGGELPPLAYAADLWLACACAEGVRAAAPAFERVYRSTIERAVMRVDRSAVDEGTQAVLVALLVPERDSPARISTYSGRSALRTWLTTIATRTTLKLRRRRDDQGHESIAGLMQAVVGDEPELVLARARYGKEVENALRTALTTLDPRHAVLLRLHHVAGWSVDRLGETYRVGRSTAARWVVTAREALFTETKRILHERLPLTPSEVASVVALVQSQLNVSLLRLLERDDSQACPQRS